MASLQEQTSFADDRSALDSFRNREPSSIYVDRNGDNIVHFASRYCSLSILKELELENKPITRTNHHGTNYLMRSCQTDDLDKIQYWLSAGFSVTDEDFHGNTPLHYAAAAGSLRTVKFLVARGAKLDAKNRNGLRLMLYSCNQEIWAKIQRYTDILGHIPTGYNGADTPLDLACAANSLEVVDSLMSNTKMMHADFQKLFLRCTCDRGAEKTEYLLRKHPFVDDGLTGFNILDYASESSNANIVHSLISYGAPYCYLTEYGDTPLHSACFDNSLAKVSYLCRYIDPNLKNGDGFIPLHLAAEKSSLDVVRHLVEKGSDLHNVNNFGENVLFRACFDISPDKAEYLISMGAKVNFPDKNGYAPIHKAAESSSIATIKSLVAAGANYKLKNRINDNILSLSCKDTCVEKIDLIRRQYDLDINSKFRNGSGALHIAAQYSNIDVLKYLISLGCDINARNSRRETVLHCACYDSDLDKVEYLITHGLGSCINTCMINKVTPLHLAFQHASLAVIQYLIHEGAFLNALDDDQFTPLGRCKPLHRKYFLLCFMKRVSLDRDILLHSLQRWTNDSVLPYLWYCFVGGTLALDCVIRLLQEMTNESLLVITIASNPFLIRNSTSIFATAMENVKNGDIRRHITSSINYVPSLLSVARAAARTHIDFSEPIADIYTKLTAIPFMTAKCLAKLFLINDMQRAVRDTELPINLGDIFSVVQEESVNYVKSTASTAIVCESADHKSTETEISKTYTGHIDEKCLLQSICTAEYSVGVCKVVQDSDQYSPVEYIYSSITEPSDLVERDVEKLIAFLNMLLNPCFHDWGIDFELKGSGSYFNNNQVSTLDELDFLVIIRPDENCIVRETKVKGRYSVSLAKHQLISTFRDLFNDKVCARVQNLQQHSILPQVMTVKCQKHSLAPAICLHVSWLCYKKHTHSIYIDLTLAIELTDPDFEHTCTSYDKPPFCEIKRAIAELKPLLVEDTLRSPTSLMPWSITYSCTNEIMWKFLDSFSPGIRHLYKYLKNIRNMIFPCVVEHSPRSHDERFEGSILSSWTLYNIVLQEVVKTPEKEAWSDQNFEDRLISALNSLTQNWSTVDFFAEKVESTIKCPTLGESKKLELKRYIFHDICRIISIINTRRTLRDPLDFEHCKQIVEKYQHLVMCVSFSTQRKIYLQTYSINSLVANLPVIKQNLGLASTSALYYYKCPNIIQDCLNDDVYTEMLHMVADKFEMSAMEP